MQAATPLAASTARVLAKLDTSGAIAPAQAPAATTETTGSPSFFKTKKGVIALVLMAGITAYTIHSRISDHIHSQVR
jgi:hypothetical protein